MKTRTAVGLLFILAAALSGCATAAGPDPGQRVLDAVVVAREYEPATGPHTDFWGSGNRYDGTGSWYLVFEARDGDAAARYRLPVTREQYMRFQEGADVRITLVGYDLRALHRRP